MQAVVDMILLEAFIEPPVPELIPQCGKGAVKAVPALLTGDGKAQTVIRDAVMRKDVLHGDDAVRFGEGSVNKKKIVRRALLLEAEAIFPDKICPEHLIPGPAEEGTEEIPRDVRPGERFAFRQQHGVDGICPLKAARLFMIAVRVPDGDVAFGIDRDLIGPPQHLRFEEVIRVKKDEIFSLRLLHAPVACRTRACVCLCDELDARVLRSVFRQDRGGVVCRPVIHRDDLEPKRSLGKQGIQTLPEIFFSVEYRNDHRNADRIRPPLGIMADAREAFPFIRGKVVFV